MVNGSKLKTVEVLLVSVSEPCDHFSVRTVVKGSKENTVDVDKVYGGKTMLQGG